MSIVHATFTAAGRHHERHMDYAPMWAPTYCVNQYEIVGFTSNFVLGNNSWNCSQNFTRTMQLPIFIERQNRYVYSSQWHYTSVRVQSFFFAQMTKMVTQYRWSVHKCTSYPFVFLCTYTTIWHMVNEFSMQYILRLNDINSRCSDSIQMSQYRLVHKAIQYIFVYIW